MPVFDFIRNSDGAKGSKRLVEVNVASIHPNPYQPRATFDEESIANLPSPFSRWAYCSRCL